MRKRGMEMKTGKRILALLMALALLVSAVPSAVFAAGADDGTIDGEMGIEPLTVIELWTYPLWRDEEALNRLISEFEDEYFDILINVTQLDYASGDSMIAEAIANGTAPDLILEGPERLVKIWGESGKMVDLSDMINKTDAAEIYDEVLAASRGSDGGLYMYPFSGTVHTMAINKTVFEAAGAMQYLNAQERTWNSTEDFFRAVQAVCEYTGKHAAAVYCGGAGGDQGTRALVTNLYGGRYTNAEHTAYTWMDSNMVDALQALRDCEGIVFDTNLVGGSEAAAFRAGELSMSFCWNTSMQMSCNGRTNNGDEILVMAFPSNGVPALQGGVWGAGLVDNGDESKIEAAKEFVRYLCDSEATADAVRATGNYAVRSAAEGISLEDVWADDPIRSDFDKLMCLMGDYYPVTDRWADARQCWYKLLQNVAAGENIADRAAYWNAIANGEVEMPDDKVEKISLNVITAAYGDGTRQWWEAFESEYESMYKKVDLILEFADWMEIYDLVEERIEQGNAPDILNIDAFEPYLGQLLPIESAMYPDTYDKFYTNFLDQSRVGDAVWAVPDVVSARALYYNADILGEVDVSVPTTWTELENACAAIQAYYGKEVFSWGMDISENDATGTFAVYMWSNEGGFVDAEGNWALNSEENIQALDFAAVLHGSDYSTPSELMTHEIQDLFAQGKVAMMIASYGFEGGLDGVNYGVANIPANDGKTASSVGVMDRMMCFDNGYSEEELEAVRAFFGLLYDDATYFRWIMEEGFLPATRTAMEMLAEDDETMEAWAEILPNCKFYPTDMPNWWDVRDVMSEVMTLAAEGEDTREILNALQEIACGDYGGGSGGMNSTEPFLSFRWLENWGDGWFQNSDWMEDGNDWSNGYVYDQSMVPGDEFWYVFYLNVWNEETGSFDATPVHVQTNEYLTGELVADMEEQIHPDAQDGDYYYHIRVNEDSWDQTGVISYTMEDGTVLTREISITLGECAFFSEPTVSNESFIRQVRYNRLTGAGTVFYFGFDSDYWSLDHVEPVEGYIDIPGLDVSEIFTLERVSDNVYKITLDPWVVSTGVGFDVCLNVFATDPEGNTNDWEWFNGIWCENDWQNESSDAVLGIDGNRYMVMDLDGEMTYFVEENSGVVNQNGDEIWVLEKTSLPEGVSYDLKSNTITLNNASLESVNLSYGRYDDYEGRWYTELPNRNLTIELVGENRIESTRIHAMQLHDGLRTTITGDGSLYVRAENSHQTDEWGDYIRFDAIGMWEDAGLTIAGNAGVTVEIAGEALETCWDGEEYLGERPAMTAAIRGGGGSLTLKDNASLTTIVPEGSRTNGEWIENEEDVIWDDRTPGGYQGIDGMVNITVEGGILNTQELMLDIIWNEDDTNVLGSFTQSGGIVNIVSRGSVHKLEKWEWDEDKQEEVYLGLVDHYHYDGLGRWDGCNIEISGGELNITANATEEEMASSAHANGLFAEGSGRISISGGIVNVHTNVGDTISTSNLTVSGGVLNAVNENGCVLRIIDSWTVTDGVVNLTGRSHEVVDLGESETTIRGGAITITGDDAQLMSLGRWEWEEHERGGSLTVSGGKLTLNASNIDRYALEVRPTAEVRFGGKAQVVVNGGTVELRSDVTVDDQAYIELNDARINLNSHGDLTIDDGEIVIDSRWDLNHEDEWPALMNIDWDSSVTVNDGKLIIQAENYNKGIQNSGRFVLNGGEVSVELSGDKIGYTYLEEYDEYNYYPGFAMSSWGETTINGGVLNLDGHVGYELYYHDGVAWNPDWPEGFTTGLVVNGGLVNIRSEYAGMQLSAPARFNGGQINIQTSGLLEPDDMVRGFGLMVLGNGRDDANAAAGLVICGGDLNISCVEGRHTFSCGVYVSSADLAIEGGKIRLDAVHAIMGEGREESIHLADGMNIISVNSVSNKELLGNEMQLEHTDENGDIFHEPYYCQTVEEDNIPGDPFTGEGMDPCTSLLIVSASCGEETSWSVEDGVLIISGSGAMDDFTKAGSKPWRDLNSKITGVEVEGTVSRIGSYAFAGLTKLTSVNFLGDAPVIAENAFEGITAVGYYPESNESWTDAVMQNYGGNISWEPFVEKVLLQIVTQPVDFVGAVGEMGSFTVTAEGEGLTYQWEFSQDGGNTWQKISTSNSISVEFKANRLSYLYRCVITDAEGNTVTTDVVRLIPAEVDIVIQTQPVSYVGAVNDDVTFTVEATGNGVTYQWYYSTDGGANWAPSGSPGNATATLRPILRAYRDGYQFFCRVTDILGNSVDSDVVSMTVKAGEIIITEQPQNVVNAVLGQLYYFNVAAEGDNLEYRWQISSDGGETWQESWNQGYNTTTLGVRMNANRDGNMYRCAITSGLKVVAYTDAVVLDLQDASAQIVSQSGNVFVTVNKTATFTVEAEGMDLTYQWYRSNDKGATWNLTYLAGYNTNTLSFVGTAARAAMYMCKVTDGSGNVVWSTPVKLQILSAELKILTQPVSMTCAAGETAKFTVEAQGDTLRYQWYASSDGVTWTATYLTGYNTNEFSFAVNAARAAKLYKCVITDVAGNTVETDAVKVTIA